jgi:hypothetical protein
VQTSIREVEDEGLEVAARPLEGDCTNAIRCEAEQEWLRRRQRSSPLHAPARKSSLWPDPTPEQRHAFGRLQRSIC